MALTHPWFLLGLLALAIPVIIHLFELRKPKKAMFSNTSFIQEVKLVTARQQKLKHLLILLARLGFVLFLVFMFCQPYLPAPQQEKSGEDVKVLVDASPSMQVQGEDEQSAFDRAVEEAQDLPSAYSASTYFQLINKPNARVTGALYRSAVEQLSISGQTAPVKNAVIKLAGQAERGVHGQTYIFSDFQKNDFSPQLLTQFDTAQQVFLVPVAGKETKNVYVDSLMLDDAFVRADTDIAMRIRLRNGGNVAANECQVKVFVGERQAAAFQTAVAAGSSSTTAVRVRLLNGDLQKCRIEVEDFPVTFDNTYYFTLQAAPKIRITELAVGDGVAQRLYKNEPLFDYALSKPTNVNYQALGAANLILLQEVGPLEASLRENLRQAVQKGKTLVIVPPANLADKQTYNALFHDLGLGAVQWEPAPSGQPVLRDVAAPNAQNPFFRDVFAQQNRPPVMPKAAPIVHWSRSGAEVLRMRDGEAYLAGFPSGQGIVYLFSAPFSGGYSDFTKHALFVPVMYRLAMQSYHNDQRPAYRLNQRTLALAVEGAANERVYKLVKDSLTFIPAQRVQTGELRFDVPPGMQTPGFYQLVRDGRPITTLAFNFDKHESELGHYSAQELRAMIGPDRPNIRVYDASGAESVAQQYKAERVGTPLWRYCLGMALACLLIEVLLLRFGARRQSAIRQPLPQAA